MIWFTFLNLYIQTNSGVTRTFLAEERCALRGPQKFDGATSSTDFRDLLKHLNTSSCSPAFLEIYNFIEIDDCISLQVGVAP